MGGEAAGTTIQYYVDGVAVTDDESGFGLDAYESLFFNSVDSWGAKPSKVTLTLPVTMKQKTAYYFNHIFKGHVGMVKINGVAKDATGT